MWAQNDMDNISQLENEPSLNTLGSLQIYLKLIDTKIKIKYVKSLALKFS